MRFAIYTRTGACDRAEQDAAIDLQRQAGRMGAEQRGGTVVAVYADRGIAGVTFDRPALNALRAAVAQRAIDGVVVTARDRLARGAAQLTDLEQEFRRSGVSLYVVGAQEQGRDAG